MIDLPQPHAIGLHVPSWRPGQEDAVHRILQAFRFTDSVILCAPPGSGKSVVAVAVARALGARTLILMGTKALQQRYATTPTNLPFATGRQNHPCPCVPGVNAAHGPCRFGFRCPERQGGCPYFQQRDAAIAAPIAVANYALVLSDTEGSLLDGRQLVVMDEAHLLEPEATQHFAVEIDLEMARTRLHSLPPLPHVIEPDSYRLWAEAAYPILKPHVDHHYGRVEERHGRIPRKGLEYVQSLTALTEAVSVLRTVDETWLPVCGKPDNKGLLSGIAFKPIRVDVLLQEHLWQPGTKRLLMSGSVGDASALANAVGLGDHHVVSMTSTISPERRPIIYWPSANVTESNFASACVDLGLAVNHLVEWHKDIKGIVHTHRGDLARYLASTVYGCRVFSHSTEDRAQVFAAFRASSPPAVLISPSVNYGEDFPDDMARWQAIAKVPYLPLGDPWVRCKKASDPTWYDRQAVQGLLQAVGRVSRGPDDWGLTYILDQQFEKLYRRSGHLFTQWFHDGLRAGGWSETSMA